ncbi:MAG: hypothetical protein QM793_15035 [Muricomes sp.]
MLKSKRIKLEVENIHRMGIAFASARMQDHKYPADIESDELIDMRYSNFLTDYAYIIAKYQKASQNDSSNISKSIGKSLNVSLTLFDSLFKIN